MQRGRSDTSNDISNDNNKVVSSSGQHTSDTVAALLEEISVLKEAVKKNESRISNMETQMTALKDTVRGSLSREPSSSNASATSRTVEARLEVSIRRTAVSEVRDPESLPEDQPPDYETQPPETPPQTLSFSERVTQRIRTFPDYRGYIVSQNEVNPVSFITVRGCIQMGWERDFQEGLDKLYTPRSPRDARKWVYLQGCIKFMTEQHAVALVVKTQKNEEHNFHCISQFDGTYGEERELFFDRMSIGIHDADPKIFYGGVVRIVSLQDLYPGGFAYHESLNKDFHIEPPLLGRILINTQTQRPPLRKADADRLVECGVAKVEFVALQRVGFNKELYEKVTASPPPVWKGYRHSQTRDVAMASGSRSQPSNKRPRTG